ncbi:MAG: hypothetical protein ACTSU0_02690 [Alphaproteobacteria bacterium]
MLRCTACGTEWMARRRVASPYRNGFQGRMVRDEVHDSLIIEHYPPAPDTDAVAMRRANGARGWAGRIIATAVIVIGVFAVARAPVVAAFSDDARPAVRADHNALQFRKVYSERSATNGQTRLVVEGQLINPTATDLALPSIKIALVGADGTTVRSWRVNLAKSTIGPGETIGFRSGSAIASEQASDVRLSFVPRLARTPGSS